MKKILISTVLLIVSNAASSATIYLDETDYLNALASSGYSTIYESFEDDNVWVRSPTLTSSTTSQGLVWESNSFSGGKRRSGDHNGDRRHFTNLSFLAGTLCRCERQ